MATRTKERQSFGGCHASIAPSLIAAVRESQGIELVAEPIDGHDHVLLYTARPCVIGAYRRAIANAFIRGFRAGVDW